ncbi:hypothetical protein O181_035970 [Austropuccinia psidii MF-1]|uniref:Uncharacterized protein n=1 Tax=Austropuccinia psidii MF-1 TaxID=1389203 RepID=A0A9Q3HBQ2_9BASI|nr:hypothetical protein [Austropuccinia psidii MF-1]
MRPETCGVKGTSEIDRVPPSTGRSRVTICNIEMEEAESAREIVKGRTGRKLDAKTEAPVRWMDTPLSTKTFLDEACLMNFTWLTCSPIK